MRLEKQITRTVTSYKAVVMLVNIETKTVENREVLIPDIPTEKHMKFLENQFKTTNEKPVTIVSETLHEELYACSESEFLRVAHKIDKR